MLTAPIKKEEVECLSSAPPGFKSLTSFTLKRIDNNEFMAASAGTDGFDDYQSLTQSFNNKPWINFPPDHNVPPGHCNQKIIPESLPRGVLRACSESNNCPKEVAKWRPQHACRPVLEEAPVFHPTQEEFKDALMYIATIRPKAQKYGVCRIVPPPSWDPPCPLKEKSVWENSKFATRIQQMDKLQNRGFMTDMSTQGYSPGKKRKYQEAELHTTETGNITEPNELNCQKEAKPFGFEPGPTFTLEAFQKYANEFKSSYFVKDSNLVIEGDHNSIHETWEPSPEEIEGEYWRIVEKPTEEIEVLYGADLDTRVFGSGFPNESSSVVEGKHLKSDWNLNNIARLPGSVLSFEKSDIPGVLYPWLYIGMCFSSFCWHVEDHYLYSLNYMHWGAPKIWYGVPGADAPKLEAAMKKHLPDLFEKQPDLLHNLVTQISPSILASEGVPVYRCVQRPKEFVLTFPRAYHAGFNCGFNCAEAINVAPLDWFPHGQQAVDLYSEQRRRTTISHDKLLFGAARETVRAHWELQLLRKNTLDNLRWKEVCGKESVLAKTLKKRVEMERTRRDSLCFSNSERMDCSFDESAERECIICLYDLHLSAIGCKCCPEIFACLSHANQLCTCALTEKIFLFRYTINDLDGLVEAVEGKLSAIYKWAKQNLGLSLSPFVSKDKLLTPRPDNKPFFSSEGIKQDGNFTFSSLEGIKREASIPDVTSSTTFSPRLNKKHNFSAVHPTESSRSNVISLCSELAEGNSKEEKPMVYSSFLNENPPNKSDGGTTDANRSLASSGTINLGDDGEKDQFRCLPDKMTVGSSKITNAPARFVEYDDKTNPSNYTQEHIFGAYQVKTSVMSERNISFTPVASKEDHISHPAHLNLDLGKGGNPMNNSMPSDHRMQSSPKESSCILNCSGIDSLRDSCTKGDPGSFGFASTGNLPQHGQPYGSEIPNYKTKDEETKPHSDLRNIAPSKIESSSLAVRSVNRYYPQKGPRVAKITRRINYIVEPLELGVVKSGQLWSCSQAIYPKGFKSRVSYLSVLDPEKCCNYISEILDAGLSGPLFMVKVETCPSEVFMHLSVTKCWEMVRDRLNEEILRQGRLGRINIPPFQPKGSIDGFEMFGFSSPEIIKSIEALDCNKTCAEYWRSRTGPLHDMTVEYPIPGIKKPVEHQAANPPEKVVLKGLLKKANIEELHTLEGVFNVPPCVDQALVRQLVCEEIQGRSV